MELYLGALGFFTIQRIWIALVLFLESKVFGMCWCSDFFRCFLVFSHWSGDFSHAEVVKRAKNRRV